MNAASPRPSGFLRPPTLLGCCSGIGTMFQDLIQQFVNLFANLEPEEICRSDDPPCVQIDPVLSDLASAKIGPLACPGHHADPVTNDPPFSQICPECDALDSERTLSCRSNVLEKIKDQLISRSSLDLKVVPIVGMGGIGKTTLAKTMYDDVEISYRFHLRAWIAISQDYNLRHALLSLLKSVDSVPDKVSEMGNEDLAQALYKCLKGRRFLIVLDDVWNAETWNDFKWIFPNDNNGSRIVLTSRLMEVASYVEPNSPPNCLGCLSDEESWRLLHGQVFDGKACPSDLVEIGKEIAKKCQGLPLAIVVVAGHISRIEREQHCWADVARALDSLLTTSKDKVLDILRLSYNHLPRHLKACFLYMGIFPKNSEINVQKLIRMLSVVGFLKSEDEAEQCLKDLINRNLIMVRNQKYGRDWTFGIHDLLWDLSLIEAQKDGHYIFNRFNLENSRFKSTNDNVNYLMTYLASSYVHRGYAFGSGTDVPWTSICFSLLTVLDIHSETFFDFPEIITNLIGLRYLELCTRDISGSVSKLHNLETLINRWSGDDGELEDLPKEIWLLPRLRHLQVGEILDLKIPDHCNNVLETLGTIRLYRCGTKLFFSRVPNLKQLKIFEIDGICFTWGRRFLSCLKSLVNLHRLEKLNLKFKIGGLTPVELWSYGRLREVGRQEQIPWCDLLPYNLKQLTLSGSCLQWEGMNILAKLPNIEVLKLKVDAFVGVAYEQTVKGFPRLKILLFEGLEHKYWIAERVHYPVLQHLVLRYCSSLEEIPCCFEEIETLKSIELVSCRKSVEKSAKTIQQEQQNNGSDIQVFITSNSEDEMALRDMEEEITDSEEETDRDMEEEITDPEDEMNLTDQEDEMR